MGYEFDGADRAGGYAAPDVCPECGEPYEKRIRFPALFTAGNKCADGTYIYHHDE